jgi:hypothetical protein
MSVKEFMTTSNLIFFKPTKKFFDFFRQPTWRWREYHDCGAGQGWLTAEMQHRGFDCTGYDLHPRNESLAPVQQFDTANIADKMDFGAVALIARPCHHPGLIDTTSRSALEMGEAFYVGKPDKLGEDLLQFEYNVVAQDVGVDGELLARIHCDIENFKIRRKLKVHGCREEYWWYSPGRDRYTSDPGGLSGFENGGETVLEEEHWATDLQVVETAAPLSALLDSGWIAPDGEWFGCEYAQHDYIAQHVLGCSVKRLEKLKFCRCHEPSVTRGSWTIGNGDDPTVRPTSKQKRVLVAHGYNPNPDYY